MRKATKIHVSKVFADKTFVLGLPKDLHTMNIEINVVIVVSENYRSSVRKFSVILTTLQTQSNKPK